MNQDLSAHGASTQWASTAWIVLLVGASMALTAWLHCLMPFSALAAVAAVHMRRGDGLALIVAAWVVNQATGYLALDYPTDPTTIAWGFGIGAAAVAAVVAAGAAAARVDGHALRLAAAFAAGFVAFKAVLLLCSFELGGTVISASPTIAAKQLLIEVPVCLALAAAYRLLVAVGVPAARGQMAAGRVAAA